MNRETKTQKRLYESERRLETLLSNLPGMAYRCLNDDHWTMLFVSQGCDKLTGYQPAELTDNRTVAYNQLVYPEDRPRVREEVRAKLGKGQHFEIKYRIRTRSGAIRWVWERGTKVPCQQSDCQVIEGFITDITEMKSAEKALIEKEKTLQKLKDRLQEETIHLRREIQISSNFEEIISRSDIFRQVLRAVEKVADTDSTVLILGETGTGKELIARALHNNSSRSNRSLITVNCAALPPDIIESELFGHEKGAFTGAYEQKSGRFEVAHEGTLFLDEIGDLPLALQTKLLRVLQNGEFQRLGSSRTTKTDVRVIAATNRDIETAVRNGAFREDLYYRLYVFPIRVPPLRQRKEDIPLLVQHFIKKYTTKTGKTVGETSQKFMQQLMSYDWPGNVRELENIIERAVILSEDERIRASDWIPSPRPDSDHCITSLAENEREHILKTLQATNWRLGGENGAAKLLKIKRTTLQSRMKKLGIKRAQ
ncbi:PAS domain-containing protein [candidate division KSB1 bacterium]|nr:PAS domain-containing protein [candidate division KSB1 bacterium]